MILSISEAYFSHVKVKLSALVILAQYIYVMFYTDQSKKLAFFLRIDCPYFLTRYFIILLSVF